MDDVVLKIRHDAKRVFREMLPSVEWSMERGVLSAQEAADLLTEEILATVEVLCRE